LNSFRRANLLWLLLPAVALGMFGARSRPSRQARRMIDAIDEGSVLAWARHITGQDPNDMTSWDEFESVAVIPGRSARANGDTRLDDEIWVVVKRTVNGTDSRYIEQFQPMDWGPDPNYCWFVDCGLGGSSGGGTDLTQGSAPSTTYKYTYFSEPGTVWGVPLTDGAGLTLDNAAAVDNGDGTVDIPVTGHNFVAGEKVRFYGTTNYDGTYTLHANTTTNILVITETYVAETFDGTESVLKTITGLGNSFGGATADSSGNIYYVHKYDGASALTKIATDGTQTEDDVTYTTIPGGAQDGVGVLLSGDESCIYLNLENHIAKYNLSTKAELWCNSSINASYDFAIDADDNVYAPGYSWEGTYYDWNVKKLDADTGNHTNLMLTGQPKTARIGPSSFATIVDDTLSIVICGGSQAMAQFWGIPASTLYNLSVRTLDNSAGDQVAVGGTYVTADAIPLVKTYIIPRGCIACNGTNIYVLSYTPTCTLYKYSWDGASLSLVTSVAGPTYGSGIHIDYYGNVLVTNTDGSTTDDIFYFYDTDLVYQSKVESVDPVVLALWSAAITGANYIQGSMMFYVTEGAPADPNAPDSEYWTGYDQGIGLTTCVYADGRPIGTFVVDANGALDLGATYDVVIAGINYYSIFETTPLWRPGTVGRWAVIDDVTIDFYESMGAHVGANMDYSADWLFSDDEFATAIPPFSGFKGPAPFLRGPDQEPEVYIWEWDPIPMTIRSIGADMEVTIE
jgi:hypothetical protein